MGELRNAIIPDPHVPQTEWLQIGDHLLYYVFYNTNTLRMHQF